MTDSGRRAPPRAPDFARLFDALPTAYLVMTPDLVIVEANVAYLRLLQRDRTELIGVPVFQAFPPTPESLDDEGHNLLQVSFERARDTGRADAMPLYKYDVAGPDGRTVERFWSLISAPVLGDDGTAVLVLQRVEDVTDFVRERQTLDRERRQRDVDDVQDSRATDVEAELFRRIQDLHVAQQAREVAARRLPSLAEVALQLPWAETVEDLERIVVDAGLSVVGADGGAIITVADDGGWRVTASPSLGAAAEVSYGHTDYDSPLPACSTARTGQRLLPTVESGLHYDPVMIQVYTDIPRRGWAFLPLTVRGRHLGSLAVAWVDEHRVTPEEMGLLDGFAAQCALALHRILANRSEQAAAAAALSLSEALQRALLTQPPISPELDIAVRSLPTGVAAQVGGDWFDVFAGRPTGPGHHRSRARQPRHRSAGAGRTRPGRRPRGTAAAVDQRRAPATVAAPARRPHPTARRPRPDAGRAPTRTRQEYITDLPKGSTLVLYTDGLVERRDEDIDVSLERLRDAVSHLVGNPDSFAEQLLSVLLPTAPDDDVAQLVVHVGRAHAGDPRAAPTDNAPGTRTVMLDSDPRALVEARTLVPDCARHLGDELLGDAEVLISELVGNAVRHGTGPITVRVDASAAGITASVTDTGTGLPRGATSEPGADRPSGRGLLIVASSADDWGVTPGETAPGKTVWFRLHSPENPPLARRQPSIDDEDAAP